jgi:dTDP-4-amino-4,6-dideoxygalactose transaminase
MIQMNKPALLGGEPFFHETLPVARPVLPPFTTLSPEITELLASGKLTKGPYLQAFERALASHLRVNYAIAVSSCTSGLMLAYKCLDLSGEVIVPSYTFAATVSALVWAGLRPVFVDVEPLTMNLDPNAIETRISAQTSAIVAVHNFGNPANIEALEAIAQRHGLALLFDAAHAFGSRYRNAPLGAQGNVQVFSMSPTKLLTTAEGGVVTTNDAALAERICQGREYGLRSDYDSHFAGINARLPEFNALLGLHTLPYVEQAAIHRNKIARFYRENLGALPGIEFQKVNPLDRSSWKDFCMTVDPPAFGISRDTLARALTAEHIETRRFYTPAVHRQTAYRQFDVGLPLPHTEHLAETSLCLPIWSDMPEEVATTICSAIERIHAHAFALSKMEHP